MSEIEKIKQELEARNKQARVTMALRGQYSSQCSSNREFFADLASECAKTTELKDGAH